MFQIQLDRLLGHLIFAPEQIDESRDNIQQHVMLRTSAPAAGCRRPAHQRKARALQRMGTICIKCKRDSGKWSFQDFCCFFWKGTIHFFPSYTFTSWHPKLRAFAISAATTSSEQFQPQTNCCLQTSRWLVAACIQAAVSTRRRRSCSKFLKLRISDSVWFGQVSLNLTVQLAVGKITASQKVSWRSHLCNSVLLENTVLLRPQLAWRKLHCDKTNWEPSKLKGIWKSIKSGSWKDETVSALLSPSFWSSPCAQWLAPNS